MTTQIQYARPPLRRRVVGILALAAAATGAAGCTALRNAFGTGTGSAPELELRNDLAQAVNIYVSRENATGEVFLRLVDAGAVDTIRLRGVPFGRLIRLRATTVSGDRTVEQDTIVAGRASSWHLRAQ
jgi:hypothetical protein